MTYHVNAILHESQKKKTEERVKCVNHTPGIRLTGYPVVLLVSANARTLRILFIFF